MDLQTGVTRLTLQAFRSYRAYDWSISLPKTVALIGPNGVGKTNLLEALSLLTPGRGLKGSPPQDWQADHLPHRPWSIAATVQTPSGLLDIGTARVSLASDRRLIKIADCPVKTQKEAHNYLYALWLTPQMDGLFRESESGRRRFLDRLVLGFKPGHGPHVTAYEKALRERQRLLEEGGAPFPWLDGLEAILATEGVCIIQNRLHVLAQLATVLEDAQGPFPKARLHLEGALEEHFLAHGRENTLAFFQEWLRSQRTPASKLKSLERGAHKSKLRAFFPGDIPAEKASTGQQKILLMSIILAACRLHARLQAQDKCLLLLLDDVMAHLDLAHRQAFLEVATLLPFQLWISGTDPDLLSGYDAERLFLKH